jgi:hypothetical protein
MPEVIAPQCTSVSSLAVEPPDNRKSDRDHDGR